MDGAEIIERIRRRSIRLEGAEDLDRIVEAIGDAELVLLGEASHGTSEFYTIRTELSKRLIREKGFNFIAVEGDWPACYALNRYIKGYHSEAETPREALREFNRWPTWMWANREVMALAQWLRQHNAQNGGGVGFYGLDVYSLWESMDEVIHHLERTGAPELAAAKRAFACFDPFSRDPQTYGVSAAFLGEGCEAEVIQLLQELRVKRKHADQDDDEGALSDEINALVAVNAERYYRSMVHGGPDSWNVRDQHMVEALKRILNFHGPGAKAILWEHNTHIGDARATDMVDEGMVNVGQLVREQFGRERVFAVGFGTHRGSVIAAREWGGPIERMTVPPAMPESWEELLHRAGAHDQLLLFDQADEPFDERLGHRAIGVVYHPQWEMGNYVPTRLSDRYDAFIYIDESKAVEPLVQEVLYV